MIDKDKVMPLIINPIGQRPVSARAQRDADWERVRPLVEALKLLATRGNYKGDMYSIPVPVWAVAQAALAQLGKKP